MATERQQGDDLDLDVNLDEFSLDDDKLFADLDNEVRLDAEPGGDAGNALDLGGDLDLGGGSDGDDGLDLGGDAGGDLDGDLDLGDLSGGDDGLGDLAASGDADAAGGDAMELGGDLELGDTDAAGELDLGDDLELGDDTAADAAGSDDTLDLGDDVDLGGDLDLGDDTTAGAPAAAADDLELGGDLDLELDGEPGADTASGGAGALDLGDDVDLGGDLAGDLELGDDATDAAGDDLELGGEVGDELDAQPADAAPDDLALPEDTDFSFDDAAAPDDAPAAGGAISVEDDDLGGDEMLSLEAGDLDLPATPAAGEESDFQAMPDVDLDDVDLGEVGLDAPVTAGDAGGDDSGGVFEAAPDVVIDDVELEGLGDVAPPDLGMPDPFREHAQSETLSVAGSGTEDWSDDDYQAAPDVRLSDSDVVELNLDDLDPGSGAAVGRRAPAMVGEAMELPADATELRPDTGAIPSDVLLSIPRKVNVEMGSVTLNGSDLMQLAYGSVVQLSQTIGDPVELVLEGQTIAQGEIVLINGRNLGVRILSLRK